MSASRAAKKTRRSSTRATARIYPGATLLATCAAPDCRRQAATPLVEGVADKRRPHCDHLRLHEGDERLGAAAVHEESHELARGALVELLHEGFGVGDGGAVDL